MTPVAEPEATVRTAPASIGARGSWLAPACFAGIVLAVGVLYWPSTSSLVHEWLYVETSSYGHGPFIILVALWLGIRAIRGEAAPVAPEARALPWGFALLLVSFLWLLSLRSGIQVAHQLLLPVIVWLTLRLLLGKRIAILTLVPVLLIYSAIPVWHVAVPALQATTVKVVGTLLRVVGISAFVDGDFVYIRNAVFHVEEGCAGLRYFIVGVTLAGVLGELRQDAWRARIWLALLAALLSLVANWVRVFVVVVAGYLTDMQSYLVRVEHVRFGWLVFAVAMAAFLWIARRWGAAHRVAMASPTMPPASGPAWSPALPFALLALACGPAWSLAAPVRVATAANVSLPASAGNGVAAQSGCASAWRPEFPGADREVLQQYGGLCAYVATYLFQHQDKELIGYYSRLYGAHDEVIAQRVRDVNGHAFNEVQLAGRAGSDQLVWYAYAIGGRLMRRGIEAQLSYAAGSLHGAPASSVIALSAPCAPDCAAAREQLAGFAARVQIGNSPG